jgi:hypothetical protein
MWDSSAMWDKFVDAVGRHFRFLETEFGFARTSAKCPFVTYESDRLEVSVFYDAFPGRRHELDLGIGRLGDDRRMPFRVGVGMLMRLREGTDSEGYLSPFPSTEEQLEAEVRRLAELLRKYGSALLSGDLRDFERLEQQEKELAREYGRKRPPPTG